MKIGIKGKIIIYAIGITVILMILFNLLSINLIIKNHYRNTAEYILEKLKENEVVGKTNAIIDRNIYREVYSTNKKNENIYIEVNESNDGRFAIQYIFDNEQKIVVFIDDSSNDFLKNTLRQILIISNLSIIIFSSIFTFFISKYIKNRIDESNNVIQKVMVSSDVSINDRNILDEFSILEEKVVELNKMSEENIKKLNKERLYKKQLMLSLSHEIKTPIGGLNGMLEGMLDYVEPYTDRDKYIRECRKLSERLSQIANEMLDVTKIDSLPEGREEVNLKILIDEIVDGFSALTYSKKLEVALDIDNRISIFTDSRILKRSLINIIENAIKYSCDGSQIIIKSDKFNIMFYNQCDYLTNDDLQFVFKPLYRGTTKRDTGGRGIGLYIVSECLEALNIKYKLENYKKGVRFIINLKGEEAWD